MFMTESMRMFAPSAAFFISSASFSSGVVGAWTTSKPTSCASFMRSAQLSLAGSMSKTRPFLMGSGAGGGVARALPNGRAAAKNSPSPQALSPAEQAVVAVDFRNSRRNRFRIHTSLQHSKLRRTVDRTQFRNERYSEARPQRNLFRSIFGSPVSRDFTVSSQVTSRPLYAAVRAIMHESADSEPLSAGLWKWPRVTLSRNAFY